MRKSLIFKTVLVFSSLFILITCNKKTKDGTDTPAETNNQTTSLDSPSTLQVGLIKDMVKRYRDNDAMTGNGEPNTQSIWFDLKTLKQFIDQVEAISNNNDASVDLSRLGMRVYLSTYPKSETWNANGFPDLESLNNNEITLQYALKNTVILVPTIFSNGVHRDFDPLRTSTYEEGIVAPIASGTIEAAFFSLQTSNTSDSDKIMALNHGSLIPPPVADQVQSF